MSASDLMTALAEFVGDVLVNECGRPAPDRVLRYHGTLPHDCCTDDGFLVVNWQQMFASVQFPAPATGTVDVCAGQPVMEVRLRYVVCWTEPEADENGVVVTAAQDAEWDEDAAMLADVADGVMRALRVLTCDPLVGDPFTDAVLAQIGPRNWLRLVGTEPILPQGGCAGAQWRLYVGVRAGQAAS